MNIEFDYGLVSIRTVENTVILSATGNMGSGKDDVEKHFDELFGKGSFAIIDSKGFKEDGHPSYMWTMEIPKDKFIELVPSVKSRMMKKLKGHLTRVRSDMAELKGVESEILQELNSIKE